MQDSVIFFHDMSWCKLVHLCKRAFYSYSTDIDTSSRCLGTHRCRYFTNRKMCSWFITFKYMVNMWLEYNNRTSTNMASVDEVQRLFVNNYCCYINCQQSCITSFLEILPTYMLPYHYSYVAHYNKKTTTLSQTSKLLKYIIKE